VIRVVAIALVVAGSAPVYHSTVRPLPAPLKADLTGPWWRPQCPVPLSELRLLTVRHWDFNGHVRNGQLVVNRRAVEPLRRVFRELFRLRFPMRHMRLSHVYGRGTWHPRDTTAAFMCRRVAPSPCTGRSSGNWSQHAYGLAIDINPIENPYVGLTCGSRTRERAAMPYVDRSRLRKGMVTPAVVRAFRSVGWGWGGDWTTTKDYMHFSANGH
jgi:D-alanyl-D-alanine carboxypeptidase